MLDNKNYETAPIVPPIDNKVSQILKIIKQNELKYK